MGKFFGAILIATYSWHHQFNKWHHFFKKLIFCHDNIVKHFLKTYFSENQINISEQKVPLLKSYHKCYHNVGTLIWQTDEIINTFNIFFTLKMLEAILNGILLADYVDKIIEINILLKSPYVWWKSMPKVVIFGHLWYCCY